MKELARKVAVHECALVALGAEAVQVEFADFEFTVVDGRVKLRRVGRVRVLEGTLVTFGAAALEKEVTHDGAQVVRRLSCGYGLFALGRLLGLLLGYFRVFNLFLELVLMKIKKKILY